MAIAQGIWPTMITPFDGQGNVDLRAAAQIVDWYASRRCDGIFAVCQSSEMFHLTLSERVALGRTVVEAARGRLEVVVSGHVSGEMSQQIEELAAMSELGAQAVVLVTNRLCAPDEDDGVWIARAGQILDALPGVTFGLYECPVPYKRLMSERTLAWCTASGRFTFLKDTCCDARIIRKRLEWIREAAQRSGVEPLGLFNANSMTLLDSLRDGAAGYSGVMANLHPELYAYLFRIYRDLPERAEDLQALLTLLSSLESHGYPICAKQHMVDEGIHMGIGSRTLAEHAFDYEARVWLEQVKRLERSAREALGITIEKGDSANDALAAML